MKLFKIIKTGLRKIDLFGSNEFLRYKGDGKYQTLTGGVTTLILIILFSIVFLQNLSSVIHKSTVTSNDAVYYLSDPTYTSFKISESMFIFGIGITKYNLNDKVRYFDITISTQIFSNGQYIQSQNHQFQPCEQSQWSKVNKIGLESFHKIPLDNFICPKSDLVIEMQGKFTSKTFKLLRIKISKCNNSTDLSRPCVDQQQIKNVPYFNLNFYFMNPFVNSGNLEPVDYYLQDRNYFPFRLDSTLVNNIYLSEHIIKTDSSLLPNENQQSASILLARQLAESKSSLRVQDQYLNIYLRKSPQYIVSTRSFQKFDSLFSYIGGLFGFAITFFFILNFYTQASYEVSMGSKLFSYDQSFSLQSKHFNFLTFLGYILYSFFRFFNVQIPWECMKKYYDCKEEVSEQLDIAVFMNKITFIEKCMYVLLQQHQFRAISMQQRPSVAQAKQIRHHYGINRTIHKNSKKISHQLQSKMSIQSQRDLENNIKASRTINSNEKDQKDIFFPKNGIIQLEKDALSRDIAKLIGDLVLKRIEENSSSETDKKTEKSNKVAQKKENQNAIDLETANVQGLKYISTVMNDIQLLQKESHEGNSISRRIYDRLSNEISREQFLALKCLEHMSIEILQSGKINQKDSSKSKQAKKESSLKDFFVYSRNSFENEGSQNSQQKDKIGLQIVLQTNDRLDKTYI